MNILILNVSKLWAGTEAHSLILARELDRSGVNVIIGCLPEGPINNEASNSGIRTLPVNLRKSSDKLRAAFEIKKIVKSERIDLIVANCGNEVLPVVLANAFSKKTKSVFFMHGMVRISPLKRAMLSKNIDRTIAVSSAVNQYLLDCGFMENDLALIHNGIDTERFKDSNVDVKGLKHELGIGSEELIVGTAVRLCPEKGVFQLLEAFSMLKVEFPTRLLIAGDGPSRVELERHAVSLGVSEKVVFTGIRFDIERIYGIMDVFVLPSIYQEPFGLVVIEAMSMRKPVVATRVGGVVDIISDGKEGLLVEPGDTRALSESIARVLEDKELAGSLSENAYKRVNDKFTSKAMSDNLLKLFNSL
jgi:glycosyltransferase involved in cell wall biosynthesis